MTEEPELLRRSFDATLTSEGDGRTLEGLCVPYNVPAQVDDGQGPYKEMFVKGAFARAVKAPNRVFLNFEHKPGISNVLGHGLTFQERDDGLYGSLEIDDGEEGNKALRLYRQGILGGLSVEFKPMSMSRTVNGVVERNNVHLDAVALCRTGTGAYKEAQVLAVRTDSVEKEIPDTVMVRPFDPELAAGLSRLGFDIPDGLTLLEPGLLERAFTQAPWDGASGRWPDADSYCQASMIDDNPSGQPKTKALCHLPIREPGSGDININAVRAALARVDQVQTSSANKASARRRLEAMLAQFNNQQNT